MHAPFSGFARITAETLPAAPAAAKNPPANLLSCTEMPKTHLLPCISGLFSSPLFSISESLVHADIQWKFAGKFAKMQARTGDGNDE